MQGLRDGITVVVTVFNKAYCLPLVLAALKAQSYGGPIAYIFVDDGSTDDSLAVLRELTADLDHVLVLGQRNAGPAAAFNLGLGFSNTVLTKGLDGDDLLVPHAIAGLLDALRAHPNARWAYGPCDTYEGFPPDPAMLAAKSVASAAPARAMPEQLRLSLGHSHTNPSAWLAETALLREIGFCDPTIFIQDYSIELRMAARAAVAYVPSAIFFKQAELTERRTSSDQRQTLHDICLATANFFAEYPNFIGDYGWPFAQRNAGRAWRWVRRHSAGTMMSPAFRRYALSKLRIGDPLDIMRQSCRAFGADIRRPGPASTPMLHLAKGSFQADPQVAALAAYPSPVSSTAGF